MLVQSGLRLQLKGPEFLYNLQKPLPSPPTHTGRAVQAWPDSELILPYRGPLHGQEADPWASQLYQSADHGNQLFLLLSIGNTLIPYLRGGVQNMVRPTSAAGWAGPRDVRPSQTSSYPALGKRQASV